MTPDPQHQSAILRWLRLCILLVVCMVALGGVTRLTESGLSIVEWKLVGGTLPPLSTTDWETEFAEYRTSPQFQKVNAYFTLTDFKRIFWLEYLHRLLGRIIGLVIVGGTACFGLRKRMPRPLTRRMLAICALTATQGTVGWVMVASGLVDQPRVAPVKLGLHLLLAFSLFSALLWTFWQARGDGHPHPIRPLARLVRIALALVILQVALGALVAGLRAGLSYNTYPLMDGQWIPHGLHLLTPWWKNHLENILTVQFQHRIGAVVASVAVIGLSVSLLRRNLETTLAKRLIGALTLQFSLGVATLLSVVNLWLASAHQLVALLLVALLLRTVYRLQ